VAVDLPGTDKSLVGWRFCFVLYSSHFCAVSFCFHFSQINSYLTERGGSDAAVSPLASFTRFMVAVTVAFAAVCAVLAWSAALALTSFGAAAYLPRPVPLPLSFTSCLCLLVWTIGVWYTWKAAAAMASGERGSETQQSQAATASQHRRSTPEFKSRASLRATSTSPPASTAASARDDGIALIVVDENSSESAEPRP
jgi:hypothetical protein